jgi:hypothetical protein
VLEGSPVIVLGDVQDPLDVVQVEPPFELYSICAVEQLLVVKFTVRELLVEVTDVITGATQHANE